MTPAARIIILLGMHSPVGALAPDQLAFDADHVEPGARQLAGDGLARHPHPDDDDVDALLHVVRLLHVGDEALTVGAGGRPLP